MFGNLFNMKNILITAYILSYFKEVAPLFLSRTQVRDTAVGAIWVASKSTGLKINE
jgi:hypothetical protein